MKRLPQVVAFLSAVILWGCGDGGPGPNPIDKGKPASSQWTVTSVNGKSIPAGTTLQIVVPPGGGRLSGELSGPSASDLKKYKIQAAIENLDGRWWDLDTLNLRAPGLVMDVKKVPDATKAP